MKYLYYLSILVGLLVAVYFYGINFNNMSETQLVNSVLYWYVPLTFGFYGIAAYKVRKLGEKESGNAIQLIFSGKNTGLTILGIFLLLYTGVFGILLFIVPLLIFDNRWKVYDFLVALVGAILWLVGLWAFFFFLWSSL